MKVIKGVGQAVSSAVQSVLGVFGIGKNKDKDPVGNNFEIRELIRKCFEALQKQSEGSGFHEIFMCQDVNYEVKMSVIGFSKCRFTVREMGTKRIIFLMNTDFQYLDKQVLDTLSESVERGLISWLELE